MKLLARIGAPFAWKVVRQHDGYTYFEESTFCLQCWRRKLRALNPYFPDEPLNWPAPIPFEL
jgi:hypothetical protein